MQEDIYANLQKKVVALTLIVATAPLLILGLFLYTQFESLILHNTREQIGLRVQTLAESVDVFLRARAAVLSTVADTHPLEILSQDAKLGQLLGLMNQTAGAFVDLGVIDAAGIQLAYAGPYDLKGRDYHEQDWFAEVMSRGFYRSDVFTGFRKLPHFIVAVRRNAAGKSWVLRTTIDLETLADMLKTAQTGLSGDAYLINQAGAFQTGPRFQFQILEKSPLSPTQFGGRLTILEMPNARGQIRLFAGSWLRDRKWLLIIEQDARESMQELFTLRNVELLIVGGGIAIIVLTVFFTTRMMVRHLRRAETHARELDANLVQADKLAALGKMAASVAHEINNPLAVILQQTGWISDLIEEDDLKNSANYSELRDAVGKIEKHVERARKVVHGMLHYARRMEPHHEEVDVNATIDQTVTLLENYARTNSIDIQTDLADNLPHVASDQAKLQQVFFNLISNAIDAIGTSGQIEIKSWPGDGHVWVSVNDNGPGIPPERQKKIFEPFFTTKAEGKGTGLGLWIIYNIVEKMGGKIQFSSQVGVGTTFTVTLPTLPPDSA
jgi:two-component system NtrC family sensor kinase